MTERVKARKAPERVTATDAYRNFAEYVARAQFGGERFIVTKAGQDAVAIISVEQLAQLDGAA